MKIIYIDLDGVVADFDKGKKEHPLGNVTPYIGRPDKIPGVYETLDPITNSIESVNKLLNKEGFEPYVSDDEFILEIEDDHPRFIKFLECIKFAHNPNPGYGFLINGIESIKDDDVAKSLMFKVNETLELSDEDKRYKWW